MQDLENSIEIFTRTTVGADQVNIVFIFINGDYCVCVYAMAPENMYNIMSQYKDHHHKGI